MGRSLKGRSCRSFSFDSFRTERQALKHKDSMWRFHAPLGGARSCNAVAWYFNTAADYDEGSIFTSLLRLWPKCNWIRSRPCVKKKYRDTKLSTVKLHLCVFTTLVVISGVCYGKHHYHYQTNCEN